MVDIDDIVGDLDHAMVKVDALQLQREVQEYFGDAVSVAVIQGGFGWVVHCIVKGNYASSEEVGGNEIIIPNQKVWEILKVWQETNIQENS